MYVSLLSVDCTLQFFLRRVCNCVCVAFVYVRVEITETTLCSVKLGLFVGNKFFFKLESFAFLFFILPIHFH